MTNPLLDYLKQMDEPVQEKIVLEKYVLPIDNLCKEIDTGITTVGSTITSSGSGYWNDQFNTVSPVAKTHCLKQSVAIDDVIAISSSASSYNMYVESLKRDLVTKLAQELLERNLIKITTHTDYNSYKELITMSVLVQEP